MPKFTSRLKHAWNAFMSRDPTSSCPIGSGYAAAYRPDRARFTRGNERTIVTSIYNRIAMDVAAMNIEHVRLDQNGRYLETIDSGLQNCLSLEANLDQTGRAFIQDAVMSMCDEGCIAIVPVDASINPKLSNSFDIKTLRVGQILEWFPKHIRVRVYNENNGKKEDLILPKNMVAIVENPLYATMNEPNSMLQRLKHKLALLDSVDEQTSSGKMDLIIQLPYVIKSDARRKQAESRRTEIEMQLTNSKYGIAYIDGTERITQLNRSVENNLLKQIEYLQNVVYAQLGLTTSVFDGTADEKTMLNYYNRTIEPILSAIVNEMKRKFITKTARTQGQSITFFRDAFRLTPTEQLAELADKLTRNEIMTSNEFRQILGYKPSDDPGADELRNKNLNVSPEEERVTSDGEPIEGGGSPMDTSISDL